MSFDTLDDATENLLLTNARLVSEHESGPDKLVARLARGDEIQWEYVRTLAKQGVIPKQEAFKALAECLGLKIPEYQRNSQVEVRPGDYCVGRAKEAQAALNALNDTNIPVVKYRGIPLMKEGAVVNEGPKTIN